MKQFASILGLVVGFIISGPVMARGEDLTITSFADFAGQTNILLQATGNITFSGGNLALPALPPGAVVGQLTVQAGHDIILSAGTGITAGPGWSLAFSASHNLTIGTGASINLSDAGNLTVQSGGTVTGGGGTITIIGSGGTTIATNVVQFSLPISLTSSGSPVAVAAGTNVFLYDTNGLGAVSCQWFKNGLSLAGETNWFLARENFQRADAALYALVAATGAGNFTNQVQLRVLVPQWLTTALDPAHHQLTVNFQAADGAPLTAADIGNFVIQTSPDLLHWTNADLTLSTNASGGLSLPPAPLSARPCFFRILSQ